MDAINKFVSEYERPNIHGVDALALTGFSLHTARPGIAPRVCTLVLSEHERPNIYMASDL